MSKYFTKLFYLELIEEELMRIHRIVRDACDDEGFLSEFGTSKEFCEEDEEYRNLVRDFEELGRKIEPEVLDLLDRVLTLRKKYIKENN